MTKTVSFWRFGRERYALLGVICPQCGAYFVSPRAACPNCHSDMSPIARQIFPALHLPPEDSTRPVLVSVVIPSYNSEATIRATLSSVMAQDFDRGYEVILVDSSEDETPAVVEQEFPSVKLIRCSQRADPGTARNLAIACARGDIIACLDADCVANPTWLQQMVKAQEAGHPVVGGSVDNGNPDRLVAWAGFLGEFREFLARGPAQPMPHIPTCNISYQRSIFLRFGGFPTEFYPQEDLLFHWRLRQQGITLWFDPAIQVKHTHRARLTPYLRHQRNIGIATARVLNLTGDEGAFLARSRTLAVLAAPVLPLVKLARTVRHLMTYQPQLLRRHWMALPVLLLGLCAWGLGFAAGAWERR